jgi:hypothetical protein
LGLQVKAKTVGYEKAKILLIVDHLKMAVFFVAGEGLFVFVPCCMVAGQEKPNGGTELGNCIRKIAIHPIFQFHKVQLPDSS